MFLSSWFWLQGLFCCVQAFSSYSKLGLLCVAVVGFSLWCFSHCGVWAPEHGSVLVAHGPSGSAECIFPDQGLNPGPCSGRWILHHWTTTRAILHRCLMISLEETIDMNSIFQNLPRLDWWPRCDLSRRMFHVHLKKKWSLLFWDEMPSRYQLGPISPMYHLKLVIPY